MKRIILALCAIIFCLENARADEPLFTVYQNGNQLYSNCGKTYTSGFVVSYVMGVVDTASALYVLQNKEAFCIPDGVIAGQLKDVVCKGLKQNPQERQMPAAGLSFKYIAQAFPCAPAQ